MLVAVKPIFTITEATAKASIQFSDFNAGHSFTSGREKSICTNCLTHDYIYYVFKINRSKVAVAECATCSDDNKRFDYLG